MAKWEERQHPRDGDGKFANKWAGRVASRIGGLFGHHVRGRDLSGLVRDEKTQKRLKKIRDEATYDDGEVVLGEIMRMQGWDAPSRYGTDEELQAAIDHGGVELWRGYFGQIPELWGWGPDTGKRATYDPRASAKARMRQTVQGDPMWVGSGIYGNGWYTSVDPLAASHFAGTVRTEHPGDLEIKDTERGVDPITLEPSDATTYRVYDPRGLQRMVLSPEARIVEWEDQELDDFIYHGGKGSSYVASQRSGMPVRGSRVLHDYGQAAAALGYDVLRVRGQGDGSGRNADQYIVLNRTAVLFAPEPGDDRLPPDVVSEAQWEAAPEAAP